MASATKSVSTIEYVKVFSLIYLSYVVSYLCRKNYSFWFSSLSSAALAKENEGMDERYRTSASLFGSAMEISYGVGKLLAGPVADFFPSSLLLSLSIALSAICNYFMFNTGLFYLDISLWAINGLSQSFAWPALAMIFMNYFKNSPNRGTLYSILSTNQNVGSALSPIILTPLTSIYGWKASLQAPAFIGIVFSVVSFLTLKDGPDVSSDSSDEGKSKKDKNVKKDENAKSTIDIMKEMLFSPWVWSLGLGYAFLTVIRVSLADWTMVIVRDVHKLPVEVGRDCLVSLEFGGFLGGLAAGFLSDRLFGGKRGAIMVIFTLITVPSSMAIILSSHFSQTYIHSILTTLYFICGFGGFGPHMLVGLAAREIFPQAQSTAGAFTKSLGQMGGALAGYPLSQIVSYYGWDQVAYLWGICGILGAVAFAPMLAVGAGFLDPSSSKTKKE